MRAQDDGKVRGDPWRLMDVHETAGFIGVCDETVRRMFRDGRLTFARVGREYRTTPWRVLRDLGLDPDGDAAPPPGRRSG